MLFNSPPILQTEHAKERRVGFEIEFSGIDYAKAKDQLMAFGCQLDKDSGAESHYHHNLGKFTLELDWAYIKKIANEKNVSPNSEAWFEFLNSVAPLVVPLEVVCPPIEFSRLGELQQLINRLRDNGAKGTQDSLFAAYGLHINTEIPQLDIDTARRYLLAFCLLQWWLVDEHKVDVTRRLSPYVDLFPEDYILLLADYTEYVETNTFIIDYLTHNHTRNRALDMLPLLCEFDETLVRNLIDEPLINRRPAFHYRLPNCNIEDPSWSLALEWEHWLVVERLANDPEALMAGCDQFRKQATSFLGLQRSKWNHWLDTWLKDRALA